MSRCTYGAAGTQRVCVLAAALVCASACGRKTATAPTAAIVVRVPVGSGIDLAGLSWHGPVRAVRNRSLNERLLTIDASSSDPVELVHPGACPTTVPATPGAEVTHEVTLTPLLTATGQSQVGFDAPFEVRAVLGCKTEGGGRFVWQQISGPKLDALEPSPDGATARGRTQAFETLHPKPLPWGIVPMSPATQGAYEIQVTWLGAGGERASATARVTAAARTNGVPSVAIGDRLYLAGPGWQVAKRPPRALAEIHQGTATSELTPDGVGGWELADQSGRKLMVRVGRYDETPLDCGRPECHPVATRDARGTRMTNTFAFDMAGRFNEGSSLRCALACHTVGEPGVSDGGFTAVQHKLGVTLPDRGADELWNLLPRALRRLGGVGCTGCHGPAAIPQPGVARTILRVDVCAVCHDAPPRYGHVAAWRATRMAISDADPRTHAAPCARCHTTAGFLEWQDAEFLDWQKASPAADAAHIQAGISCAACHDPHGGPTAARLVRKTHAATARADDATAAPVESVCLPCHAPASAPLDGSPTSTPAASAAWILAGRGGLRIASGEEIEGPTQHAEVARGCLGCHRFSREGVSVDRGAGHGFRAGDTGCTEGSCHSDPKSIDGRAQVAKLRARARRLRAELERRAGLSAPPGMPPGAKPATSPGAKPATSPGAKPATPPGAKPATSPGAKPATPPGAKPGTPATPPGATPAPPPGAPAATPPGAQPARPLNTGPIHAQPSPLPKNPALARALYDVALVAEDPAAAYHNAAYARALLDEVEKWLRPAPGK